jgi:hypothetical protein
LREEILEVDFCRNDLSGHSHATANVVYAIYLFVTTRHGVSGKELKRELGVTHKTAWRIGHQIRQLMEQADIQGLLVGHIELDEAYVGGRRSGKRGVALPGKGL